MTHFFRPYGDLSVPPTLVSFSPSGRMHLDVPLVSHDASEFLKDFLLSENPALWSDFRVIPTYSLQKAVWAADLRSSSFETVAWTREIFFTLKSPHRATQFGTKRRKNEYANIIVPNKIRSSRHCTVHNSKKGTSFIS